MTLHNVAVAAKDSGGNAIPGGIQQHDTSGTGAGPNIPETVSLDSTGAEILGTTAGAAVTTDTNGSIQQYLRGLVKLFISGIQLIPGTSGGLSRSRTLIPNNTTNIIVKASAGQLYKIRAMNNSATIAYIKLYDAATATAGVGTPVDTIMIPAATSGGAGIVDTTEIGVAHATGITYIVTTGIADADTTAPAASSYIVTMYYK
jgi:hypothetical protein